MWYRIVYGVVRIFAAILLLNMIGMPIEHVIKGFLSKELMEDPGDLLSRALGFFFTRHPVKVNYFLTIYLGFWGVVDIVLSMCILRRQMWAYPLSLVLIALFVAYELYRISYTHSSILFVFILIDLFVFWLIYREYRQLK